MDSHATHIRLQRVDPQRNMFRFYSTIIEPNLCGGRSLIRTWGRIGTAGTTKIEFFSDEDTAEKARQRLMRTKLRRGYRDAFGQADTDVATLMRGCARWIGAYAE